MFCSSTVILLLLLLLLQIIAAFPDYDPRFARFAFEHAAAVYSENPLKCIGKYKGTFILRQDTVSCDHFHDQVKLKFPRILIHFC